MKRNAAAIALISGMLHLMAVGSGFAREMGVEMKTWGTTPEGEAVALYTLTNANGLKARVMTYGATLVGVDVPDRDGKFENVTLYLDTFEDYLAGHPLFGSVVGRYTNRIAGGGFVLDGVDYRLETVNAKSGVHIHGGKTGFQKQVWESEPYETNDRVGVKLSLESADGHEGYPGRLRVTMKYVLTNENELWMRYEAETDKATHVNLTNHAYWNLGGAGSGDVTGHALTLNAERVLEFDSRKIPTGKTLPVDGTPFDFRTKETIGARIGEVAGGGYDHCYALEKAGDDGMRFCARVIDGKSGRVMEVRTTQPGVQLYTANGLSNKLSGGGKAYGKHHGLCLETQHYPDSPNKPEFPSTALRPGEKFREITVHRFLVAE